MLTLLKKINTCSNNSDKSYTEKKSMHKPSGYSLVKYCSFDKSKNERKYYRVEECMKIFCKDLKDQSMKIISHEKKEMIPLNDEEKESYENQEVCYICKKEFCIDEEDKKKFKKMQKVRDHCHYTGKYRGAAHSNCNLKYKTTKKIPVVFRNGSTYYYHFIIKQLTREFIGCFECSGENTEKYITFSVPFKKYHDNDKTAKKEHDNSKKAKKEHDKGKKAKKQHDNGKTAKKEQGNGKKAKKPKTTTYRLKFIDSYRFT